MSPVEEKPSGKVRGGTRRVIASVLGLLFLMFAQAPAAAWANPGETVATGEVSVAALTAPKKQTLKILHFNMAGGARNNGTYLIIGRIIREVQATRPDIISLNEVCDRQYAHLLIQLEAIGYPMGGYFQESRTIVPDCIVFPDTRNEAGNAVLVRGTVLSDQGYIFTSDHKLEMREQPIITESRSVACVTALLSIPDQPVKACSTHLAPKESGASNPYAAPEAEARELARVFGPEASAGSFVLMGDLNLKPGNTALNSLYAPSGGSGQFWETDMYDYCTDTFCDGPVQGGDPSHSEGKIDYTFVSRKHFSFEYQNVQMADAGICGDHECSDHKLFHSKVYLHQTTTPYGLIRNNHSGKCATVTGTANNANAVQFTCNAQSTDYRWRFEHAWWGEYLIRKENGGRCLRINSSLNNAGATQYTCDANDTMQRWEAGYPQAGMLRLIGSGKCLVVAQTVNNAAVMQTGCNQAAVPQQWTYS